MGAALRVPEEGRVEHLRRWAPAVMLAPFLPCCYALLVVITGEIVVNTVSTDCVMHLGAFVRGAVAISYLLLLTFSWTFLGFSVSFALKGKKVELITPFRNLATLARWYMFIILLATGWWGLGTIFIKGSLPCVKTSPALLFYTVLLVLSFWAVWLTGLVLLIRKEVADKRLRKSMLKEDEDTAPRKKAGELDPEEQILQLKFKEFDTDDSGMIETEELGQLLASLGIELTEAELKTTMKLLDDSGDGTISFKELLVWYRMSPLQRRRWMKKSRNKMQGSSRLRGEGEEDDEDEEEDEDEDDEEEEEGGEGEEGEGDNAGGGDEQDNVKGKKKKK